MIQAIYIHAGRPYTKARVCKEQNETFIQRALKREKREDMGRAYKKAAGLFPGCGRLMGFNGPGLVQSPYIYFFLGQATGLLPHHFQNPVQVNVGFYPVRKPLNTRTLRTLYALRQKHRPGPLAYVRSKCNPGSYPLKILE